jgi:hypothetical protein
MIRVGDQVQHIENGRVGHCVALQRAAGIFLIRWADGPCTNHIGGMLRKV